MLTPEYLLRITEPAEEIASRLHTDILKRIVTRIFARMRRNDPYILAPIDKWQIQTLMEAGYLREDIEKAIADATGYEREEIRAAMEDAGVTTLKYEDRIYEAAGLSPTPLMQSPYMIRLMQRNYEATMGEWRNFTRTTADAVQDTFIQLCDDAYINVMSGNIGYIAAFSEAIDKLAKVGLIITYPSGHRDTIETATLRCVRTGVSQAAAQIQMARMDEMGVDLVLVSSHMGARPSHQIWQGKVYSRSGESDKYPDFVSSTGYGTGEGLCGWNCRHHFGAYFEGMENPYKHYNSKENNELYEKEQHMRSMERGIRKTKRAAEVYKMGADYATDPQMAAGMADKYKQTRARLKAQRAAYKQFCDENGLRQLPERLRIARESRTKN